MFGGTVIVLANAAAVAWSIHTGELAWLALNIPCMIIGFILILQD